MINEGLRLLSKNFTTRVGSGSPRDAPKVSRNVVKDDLSPLEVFYSSTSSTTLAHAGGMGDENNMTFVIDENMDPNLLSAEDKERLMSYEALRKARETAALNGRNDMKEHISTLTEGDPAAQPLSMFLQRKMRERATLDKLVGVEEEDRETAEVSKVCYVSSSFLVDAVYPVVDGLNKRYIFRRLRSCFTRLREAPGDVKWALSDADKPVCGTIFAPVQTSSLYEDNLQRLLLTAAFRFRIETQKITPRPAIIAFMAMFSPRGDAVIDIPPKPPTTLRGLFANILDGSLYKGHSFATLKDPFSTDDGMETYDADLKRFCDRALLHSYHAVFLTLLGVKVWVPDRYPENRFVANGEGLVTVKIPQGEVIHCPRDDVWIFKVKNASGVYVVKEFNSLLTYLYHPEEVATAASA